jgi:hypothetical protein
MEQTITSHETTTCPLCGATLPADAEACNRCDWVRNPMDLSDAGDALKVALLSLVPGLGHLYKGYVALGGIILFIIGPSVLAMALVLAPASFGTSILFLPLFLIGVILHAIQLPRKRIPEKIP